MVRDESGAPILLSLDVTSEEASTTWIDALSTAHALVFMHPFLATVDLSEADDLQETIYDLSIFIDLLSLIE